MGTWAPRALLREALCLQSRIALLVREQGLTATEPQHEDITWEEWIQSEGEKRTKFIAYCFFNLHCVAYDMPPLLLTSEIRMTLPYSAKEWKAENARQWRELRRTTHQAEITFHDALARLFFKGPPTSNTAPISSLGNYVLIHALVQQIYFVRQTSSRTSPETANNSLRPTDIDELGQALRSWQSGWERTPESSLDPSNPNGPVAFNSTALLRLAYIRLHSDLGPCRRLETRDPIRIAAAFKDSPPLIRSVRLGRAVLQSAHALSIPVRIGIAFVARTQTFSWSIQHSLCNLECAFLLSKTPSSCFLFHTLHRELISEFQASGLKQSLCRLLISPRTNATSSRWCVACSTRLSSLFPSQMALAMSARRSGSWARRWCGFGRKRLRGRTSSRL